MRALCLASCLVLAACASDEPASGPADVTIEGVDPVQTDGDLAPDATLQADPVTPPTPGTAVGGTMEPEATLQPDTTAGL